MQQDNLYICPNIDMVRENEYVRICYHNKQWEQWGDKILETGGVITRITDDCIFILADSNTDSSAIEHIAINKQEIISIKWRRIPTVESNTDDDMVSHPSHYQSETGLEAIEVIEAFTFDLKGIEATDTGNVIKYICRWKKKNGLQDLEKARWYLDHLIKHVEKMEKENG